MSTLGMSPAAQASAQHKVLPEGSCLGQGWQQLFSTKPSSWDETSQLHRGFAP